jgi:ABC-type nitrate/sulfonate/bicarbonate transport system permease component
MGTEASYPGIAPADRRGDAIRLHPLSLARTVGARYWLLALGLASWQALAASRVLDPLFFPPPSLVAETLAKLLWSGELPRALSATLARAILGLAAGVAAGGVVSILLCLSERLRVAAQPLISALFSTPRLTMLPMVMLVLGVNDTARLVMVAISVALVVVIQISDALRAVSRDYVDLAVNYGASRAVVIRKVYLPACVPQILTALRLSTGRALVMTISIEMLTSRNGIGSMIWTAWQTFSTEKLYASVSVAAAMGLISGGFFQALERRLIPWRDRAA